MVDLISEFIGPGDFTVIFEDDGRVAYCYMMKSGDIISDVWLYNRAKTPTVYPWKTNELPPYLNPKDFCLEINRELPKSVSDVDIRWKTDSDNNVFAFVIILGSLFSILSSNEKPGRALFAAQSGPLARPLDSMNS